eukprot:242609-Hanusia_phi.AAC.2
MEMCLTIYSGLEGFPPGPPQAQWTRRVMSQPSCGLSGIPSRSGPLTPGVPESESILNPPRRIRNFLAGRWIIYLQVQLEDGVSFEEAD